MLDVENTVYVIYIVFCFSSSNLRKIYLVFSEVGSYIRCRVDVGYCGRNYNVPIVHYSYFNPSLFKLCRYSNGSAKLSECREREQLLLHRSYPNRYSLILEVIKKIEPRCGIRRW
jgi:hypothetical protein